MKYRLSLDIGVGSIGSTILSLDEKNRANSIIDCGVCIFEVSEGAENRRLKRSQRKNTYRTKKRIDLLSKELAQAGLWSLDDDIQFELIKLSPYAIRAQGVNGKLNNIMEIGRAILHMAKHRGAGFVEMNKLELEIEKNNEKIEEDSDKKKKKELSEYAKLKKHLEESGAKTIGEYFFMRMHKAYKNNNITDENRRYVRQRKMGDKVKVDYAIPRYLVKEEFNLLWETQSKYYKQLKNNGLKDKIYDILFYENDSRPYATGNCIFIENEKRLTKAHPLSEKRRIYETVNNIRVQEHKIQRKLRKDERDNIINELLMKGQKAGKKSISELLMLDKTFKVVLDDMIKPYLYSMPEYKAIDFLNKLDDEKLAGIVEFMAEPKREDKKDYLYNDEKVIEILKNKFSTDDERQISQLIAMLPKGRGSLGKTATTKILELLKNDVISIREATDKLAATDKQFISEEEIARAMQGEHDTLPYYGEILKTDTQPMADWQKQINKSLNPLEAKYGKIANPAVHRILNQLRRVVNDIIRIYGRPYDINIELAREVGMSSKKKKEYETQKKKNKEKNDKAVEYLTHKDIRLRVTSTNILKWRLAEEQNWKDAFSPQDRIHPRFEGFEIEHLIPESLGGTDAPINRVLIKRSDNLNKGNMYPYEYLQNKHGDKVYGILKEIRANKNMPAGKKWRFESDAKEIFERGEDADNITRYLTDTRYVCKLAARYLKVIVDYKQGDENNTRVLTINGGHTAKLRSIWNLDGIEYDLMGLKEEVPEYLPDKTHFVNLDTGEVLYQEELDVDGNWKKCNDIKSKHWKKKPRIDHRHHIIDAITIGCVSRSDMQKINWFDKRDYELPLMQLPIPLSNGDNDGKARQLEIFRNTIIEKLKNTKAYHKPEHSKNGQLHKETARVAFMDNPEHSEEKITKHNRPVSAILKTRENLKNLLINTNTIKPEWDKDIVQDVQKMIKLKEAIESHFEVAQSQLEQENQQLVQNGNKAKKISEKIVLQRAFKIVRKNKEYKYDTFPEYENKKSFVDVPKHNVVYDSGNNYCMDFYVTEKGDVGREIITQFDINKRAFVPEWKKKGLKPLWSVQQGDMIELDTPPEWKKYTDNNRCFAVIKKFDKGFTYIKYQTDARGENRKEEENISIKQNFIGGGLTFYAASKACKIELTPFGKIARKHKKLWNGKKKTTK
ncbi:MAG: type II CRISPR RNA-guided endonuclease Cas9 [Planctomycetes bacterium GWF2_41_51]|nr:CRISPR-associated protein Cas9 [uncultured bacterium]OHB47663.1 MAG: type II CRISPR RNA-guided endonuclease Cas9 [Planctomycetes bacterium GWF2_41_51]HBG26940.1 type II CRISPR RNA-guided endonuclease Cas9 [Phycisphaerales bacterium]